MNYQFLFQIQRKTDKRVPKLLDWRCMCWVKCHLGAVYRRQWMLRIIVKSIVGRCGSSFIFGIAPIYQVNAHLWLHNAQTIEAEHLPMVNLFDLEIHFQQQFAIVALAFGGGCFHTRHIPIDAVFEYTIDQRLGNCIEFMRWTDGEMWNPSGIGQRTMCVDHYCTDECASQTIHFQIVNHNLFFVEDVVVAMSVLRKFQLKWFICFGDPTVGYGILNGKLEFVDENDECDSNELYLPIPIQWLCWSMWNKWKRRGK